MKVDIFTVEAVWLGKLQCCVVSLAAGQRWFCQQILVREGPSASHEYVFPCRRYVLSCKILVYFGV